jgi:hypothetical protein
LGLRRGRTYESIHAFLMAYSLWRNNELLGDLAVPFPASGPDTVAGMLRPTAAFTDIGELMQTRLPTLQRTFVHLHHFTGQEESGPVALQPMTPEQAVGIPPDRQLELRDDRGTAVPVDMIMINPIGIPDGVGEFPDACRAAGLAGSGWTMVAHLVAEL